MEIGEKECASSTLQGIRRKGCFILSRKENYLSVKLPFTIITLTNNFGKVIY